MSAKIAVLKLSLICLLGLLGYQGYGQTEIKVMTYNLMHFPGTLYFDTTANDFRPRTPVLKAIMEDYQPDLLLVCELENSQGADIILQESLDTDDNRYNRANFAYNQSSGDTSLQQLVFYNQQKLILEDQQIILTNIRDINHYLFRLNTDEQPVYLDVFVAHLKASGGSTNENKRLQMVNQLTTYLQNISKDHHVIFGGDFNIYYANEPAYQELLDETNAIVLNDPLDMSGYWHNNLTYQSIHTQSPLTSNAQFQYPTGSNDGVTGGLDDRFDFLMVSDNILDDSALNYMPETYVAYGNNGNCFNDNIDDTNCSGTEFSQDIRDHLAHMSDHLPVVMTLQTPYTLQISEALLAAHLKFVSTNISNTQLHLKASTALIDKTLVIRNQMGQTVKTQIILAENMTLDIAALSAGMYWIAIENAVWQDNALKFIKI